MKQAPILPPRWQTSAIPPGCALFPRTATSSVPRVIDVESIAAPAQPAPVQFTAEQKLKLIAALPVAWRAEAAALRREAPGNPKVEGGAIVYDDLAKTLETILTRLT